MLIPNEQIERAVYIAAGAHLQQTDHSGVPTILHVLRVGVMGRTPAEQVVGILHDVVEDSGITLQDFRGWGFPDEVVDALDALTRREADSESYEDYIERLSGNPLAVAVKLNDLIDNMAPGRQDFPCSALLFERHAEAYDRLVDILYAKNQPVDKSEDDLVA